MNEIETRYAWAAGFLDGEGCFSLTKTPRSFTVVLIVCQCRPEPLDELSALFGGAVYLNSRTTAAGTPIYQWRCPGGAQGIVETIEKVLPYLILKRREAELILQYCKTVTSGGKHLTPLTHARRRHIHRRLLVARR